MGFKDWAKRAKAELNITKEEIAAGAVIAMGDDLKIEVTFKKVNRKMPAKLRTYLKEQETKFGRGALPKILPISIEVNVLEQKLNKYHEIESKFAGNLHYTETRTQAKAALMASKAQWISVKEGIDKLAKGAFVELDYENGSKVTDTAERQSSVVGMDIANAVATLKTINAYGATKGKRTAAKHVDLSFGSLKKRFKKR